MTYFLRDQEAVKPVESETRERLYNNALKESQVSIKRVHKSIDPFFIIIISSIS